jgi:hypothetical protein
MKMTETIDGIYAAYMTGSDGQGFGMFVFLGGVLSGADPLGVRFDGDYAEASDGSVTGTVTVTVPPDGTVIQGVSTGSSSMTYQVPLSLGADFATVPYFSLVTPLGTVNIKLEKLKDL